jgi:hypothetical protein
VGRNHSWLCCYFFLLDDSNYRVDQKAAGAKGYLHDELSRQMQNWHHDLSKESELLGWRVRQNVRVFLPLSQAERNKEESNKEGSKTLVRADFIVIPEI